MAWYNFLNDFRFYAPVQVLYFTRVTGSFAAGMSVFSAAMLASAVLEVPTGVFSDMIGRKRTVVCGAVASAVSVTLYAIGGLYGMLLIGAVFEGLARSFFSGNNEALLYDTLAETGQTETYQEFLGKISSMFQFALASSAIIGSIVASFSFSAVMWLSVIPQVIGIFVTLRLIEPKVRSERSGNIFTHLRQAYDNLVKNPRLRPLSAASIITWSVGEAAYQFRPAFIASLWPIWAIGIARLVSNLTAAASFYLSGRLIKRFGEFPLLAGSVLYSETLNLLALVFPTVLSPLLMGTTSIFFGVKNVALGGLMQREFTSEQRATMGSLNSFASSLCFAIAAVVLGQIADRFGVINALIVASLISFIPLWLYRMAFRHVNQAATETETAVKAADTI
jgi:MFS family permease